MGVRLNVTEWMRGDVADLADASKKTRFEHEVLIHMEDIDKFVTDPKHAATMSGSVLWDDETCPIEKAEFDMLVATTKKNVKHMYYRIVFVDGRGTRRTMLGNKVIRDDAGPDLWGDITTLFIRVYNGEVPPISLDKTHDDPPEYPSGEFANGILRIPLRDGINSFLSFEAPGSSRAHKVEAVAKFIRFYGGEAFELFVRQSQRKRMLLWSAAVVAIALVAGAAVAMM